MKSKKILPAILTAAASLMLWFVIFIGAFYWYLNSFSSIIVKTGPVGDLGYVIFFYILVAALLIIFSVWFAGRFYKEGSEKNLARQERI